MKAYELLYIVDPAASEEVRAGVTARINTAIVDEGGTIDSGKAVIRIPALSWNVLRFEK